MEEQDYVDTTQQRLEADQRELKKLAEERDQLSTRIDLLQRRIEAFRIILGAEAARTTAAAPFVLSRGAKRRRSGDMPERKSEYQETTLARAIMAVLPEQPTHVDVLANQIWNLASQDDLRMAKRSLYAELSRLRSDEKIIRTQPGFFRKPEGG